jgi:hypothetical protein
VRHTWLALLAVFASCGPPLPPAVRPPATPPPVVDLSIPKPSPESAPCQDALASGHSVYRVYADGVYVGREVRSREQRVGPFGEEVQTVSILSRRLRSGPLDYDLTTIREELTERNRGALLRGLFATIDPMFARVSLVGFNGVGFDRVSESRASIFDPIATAPVPLALAGNETIGLRLVDLLAAVARGDAPGNAAVAYYDPGIPAPVRITLLPPEPGSPSIDGDGIRGVWVAALRDGGTREFVRAFVDDRGRVIEESYPSLHQTRRLVDALPPFPSESSSPSSSLLSRAYLGLPELATSAVFRIGVAGDADPLSSFSFLGEPRNQTLTRVGERELELRVVPGAPDGKDRPLPEDTQPAAYVDSAAPEIRGALQYLRSGGRAGALPEIRRANATPVVARAALIQNPTAFWKDPVSVANIVSRFVYAILPDKRPTFSMADAVTTLEQGTGDCTEHSVLFAALMRAHGVPTRLVAGLYLSPGGYWVYHMWATYWDGAAWRQIDPISAEPPGALYVAVGRGATRFTDVRPDVAAFLDRTFSGVSFDLVAASSDGESLKLSYPRTPGAADRDAASFNAAVLAVRGDASGALAALDGSISADTATVTTRMFRAELLVDLDRLDEALEMIGALRKNTSLPSNTAALDALELRALTEKGDGTAAATVLARMAKALGDASPTILADRARLLFAEGKEGEALELLVNATASSPGDVALKSCFAELAARSRAAFDPELAERALIDGREALELAHYADPGLFASLARLTSRLGRPGEALAYADSGLLLAPLDGELATLRETIAPCAVGAEAKP